ncbi:beta/gamma crystallin-related protein [Paenibacillus sp. IHBB 3054]|uniref:beta/gamma crystallin-related protein n=1 Tax=Paenibacillus sp. IHBB 3054 TaxID=3425689 RepID=UPI003F675686
MNLNENSSNSAECAQSQTMNGHSPLFDRLSTDGKPYWDYIKRYSPVIYQDINKEFADGIADLIAKFNVNGNWNMADQWETIGVVPQVPYVYASVQETKTHLFLGYYFYHVRDDGPVSAEQHENDLEGMMMAVRKDGSYGVPVAMETVSHSDFLRYRLKDPNVQPGYVGIESTSVRFSEVTHPEVFISSNGIGNHHGHGVSAYTSNEDVGDDGIVYKFGEPSYSGQPNQFSPKWKHTYNYGILPIDELWERKFHYNNTPFQSFGVFPNTHTSNNHANAPWNWSDKDQDGTLGTGIFFTDPAYLFDIDFNELGTFSHEYVYNLYWTHKVTLNSVTPKVYKDPSNNLPDIYISMDTYPLSNKRYISEKVWMKADAALNIPHPVIFGGDQKTANTTFSERTNTLHIAVSNINPRLWLEVKDYDPSSSDADDYMGSIVIPLDTGNIAGKADLLEAIIDYEVISNPSFPLAQQGVYVYKDSNFSGTSKQLTSSVTNFKDINMNDAVSSIKIVGPYDVVGYSDADFKGRSATLVTNDNLSSTYIGNDAMSSIRITRRTI